MIIDGWLSLLSHTFSRWWFSRTEEAPIGRLRTDKGSTRSHARDAIPGGNAEQSSQIRCDQLSDSSLLAKRTKLSGDGKRLLIVLKFRSKAKGSPRKRLISTSFALPTNLDKTRQLLSPAELAFSSWTKFRNVFGKKSNIFLNKRLC